MLAVRCEFLKLSHVVAWRTGSVDLSHHWVTEANSLLCLVDLSEELFVL